MNQKSSRNTALLSDIKQPIFVTFSASIPGDLEGIVMFEQRQLANFGPKQPDFKLKERVGHSLIEFSLQLKCSPNFYGDGCDIFCENPNNFDANGKFNYSCGKDGERLCSPGWSGTMCDNPSCTQGCIHGQCIAPNSCSCLAGWTGVSCQRCIPLAGCKNGYCQSANECKCHRGWTGVLCDRKRSICETSNPCVHGICQSANEGFQCDCAEGFKGHRCDQKIELPLPQPSPLIPKCQASTCKNGRCVQHFDGQSYHLTCECFIGFHGEKCDALYNQTAMSDNQRSASGTWTASHYMFIGLALTFTLVNLCGCVCCWRFMKKLTKGKANLEMDCFAVTTRNRDQVVLRPSKQFMVDEPFLQAYPSTVQLQRFSLDYPPLIITRCHPSEAHLSVGSGLSSWLPKVSHPYGDSPPKYESSENCALENALNERREVKELSKSLSLDLHGLTEDSL